MAKGYLPIGIRRIWYKIKWNKDKILCTIKCIVPLFFGILFTYTAINEQSLLWGGVAIILFFIFLHIINRYKKFWFGLAIVSFLVASLVAYNLIWIDSIPRNEPVYLTPYLSSNDPMGLWSYMGSLKQGNITNASPNDVKEYLEGKKNLSWYHEYEYIKCEPIAEVFVENSYIICHIPFLRGYSDDSSKIPFIISAESTEDKGDGITKKYGIHMELLSNISICRYTDSGSIQENCETFEHNMRGPIHPIPTTNKGLYRVDILFKWVGTYHEYTYNGTKRTLSKNIPISVSDFLQYSSIQSNLYVHSIESINQQQRERNYQFIIALFALFGIFPAVYHLRNLWRNEK